ncbi:Transcription repressor OFP13 [Ananas comosus]|uniref:Transcription repressor n=1 Tax=Ananas comosus TaxID=4615 RepID=A0A199W7J7_ANACO|nr:Transcription repressor OFP13 [Ananas comosus]
MGKKGFTSLLFKLGAPSSYYLCYSPSASSSSSWPWASSCGQPKTNSFRHDHAAGCMYKTANSVYRPDSPESRFTNSSDEGRDRDMTSLSTAPSDDEYYDGESSESVIRGIKSSAHVDRLFFEPPGADTGSILGDAAPKKAEGDDDDDDSADGDGDGNGGAVPFKESVVVAMESRDPHADFRESMEEMVRAHALKDWAGLEELLVWYLRVNGKSNHGFILGAFVDLLVALASSPSPSSSSSSSSVIFDEIEEVEERSESC